MSTVTKRRAPSRLIGLEAAANEYDLKLSKLRALIRRGQLPVLRVGDSQYLERVDVQALAQRQRVAAG